MSQKKEKIDYNANERLKICSAEEISSPKSNEEMFEIEAAPAAVESELRRQELTSEKFRFILEAQTSDCVHSSMDPIPMTYLNRDQVLK